MPTRLRSLAPALTSRHPPSPSPFPQKPALRAPRGLLPRPLSPLCLAIPRRPPPRLVILRPLPPVPLVRPPSTLRLDTPCQPALLLSPVSLRWQPLFPPSQHPPLSPHLATLPALPLLLPIMAHPLVPPSSARVDQTQTRRHPATKLCMAQDRQPDQPLRVPQYLKRPAAHLKHLHPDCSFSRVSSQPCAARSRQEATLVALGSSAVAGYRLRDKAWWSIKQRRGASDGKGLSSHVY